MSRSTAGNDDLLYSRRSDERCAIKPMKDRRRVVWGRCLHGANLVSAGRRMKCVGPLVPARTARIRSALRGLEYAVESRRILGAPCSQPRYSCSAIAADRSQQVIQLNHARAGHSHEDRMMNKLDEHEHT